MISVLIRHFFSQLLLGRTSLQLFIIRLFMHDYELSKPRVLGQALYMLLLVLNFLTTIWRCVNHAPLGRKVDLHINDLNLEFVFGE